MMELLRQFRRRRENPIYQRWGQPAALLQGWRGIAWLSINFGIAACLCYAVWTQREAEFNFIVCFGSTFSISLPLCFAWFLPRLERERLEELSLTRMKDEEIGYGLLLPPLLMALFPLALFFSGFVLLRTLTPYPSGAGASLTLALIAIVLAGYLLMLCACIRQFMGRPPHPIKNLLLSMVRVSSAATALFAAAMIVFLMLFMKFRGFSNKENELLIWLLLLMILLFTINTIRYTFLHLPARATDLLRDEEKRRTLWSRNQRVSEEEQVRRRASGQLLLRTIAWSRAAVVTIAFALALLLASPLLLLFVEKAHSLGWEVAWHVRGIFTLPASFAFTIMVSMVYGIMLRRGIGKPLPVVAGGLLRTLAGYSLVPLALGWSFLLLCAAIWSMMDIMPVEGQLVLYIASFPMLALLVFAVMLSMVGKGGERAPVVWAIVGALLLFVAWNMYTGAIRWSRPLYRWTEVTQSGLSEQFHYALIIYLMYFLGVGFSWRLQRLHDEAVGDVPRGELTLSLAEKPQEAS